MANSILVDLKTVKGKIRKRKLQEESIGSNFESTNPIIQVIGGLPMDTDEERDVLKDVLFDYSNGVFTSIVGDYWSFEFWKYICAEYNQRANSRGLQSCTEENIYTGGKILQSRYCTLRTGGMVDVKLDMIFKPCEDCNLRVVFFPTSQIAGMNYISNYVFTNSELTTVKSVLLDYSCNILQIQRGDYYSASFWNTLADVYNMRVGTQRGLCAGGNVLKAGRKLQHIFNTQRVSGIIDVDLKHIFERCENCKRRIPVFPSSLFSQSDSGFTTSTMRSFHFGTSIGNANRASTSVQRTEVDGEGSSLDRRCKVVTLLNEMMDENLLSSNEYLILLGKNELLSGCWPTLLLDMDYSKVELAGKLRMLYEQGH